MTISLVSAANPRYANADNSAVVLSCVFSHFPNESMEFRATPNDSEAHGRDTFARALSGEFGVVAPFIAPPPPPPPRVVTMRQARLALLGAGLLDSVDAAIAASPKSAQIEWGFATTLYRDHPLTISLSASLGLTQANLDELFTEAAKL